MPTKHISDITWKKVEKEMVKAVISTQTHIKDSEILNLIILKGIEKITEEDYRKLAKK